MLASYGKPMPPPLPLFQAFRKLHTNTTWFDGSHPLRFNSKQCLVKCSLKVRQKSKKKATCDHEPVQPPPPRNARKAK